MAYLVIIFLAAVAGIAVLWSQQRRDRAHLETVDGFKSSLELLSIQTNVQPERTRGVAARRISTAPGRRPPPLDPERRAAAKRRLEARRRSRSRAAH
ncbi:MAG: hypothetical protein ABR505_08365 [Actinomycetota bacterium]